MNQFRYNVALSVLFDNENTADEVEGFPISIMETPEGRNRLDTYARIRREIRELLSHSSDIPYYVEQRLHRRLKYYRYRTSTRNSGNPSFALVTIGRKFRLRLRKRKG
jgi:hypothetical protein